MAERKLEIKIVQGSILEVEAEVIVNAANSLGFMSGDKANKLGECWRAEQEQD